MDIPIPKQAAVMVLPGATLFPHAMLPLHIFEQQYREMLVDALAGNRLFCIGCQCGEDEDPREFRKVGSVGMIRACVAHPDGTSHLVLQGLERVRFETTIRSSPYRLCEITVIESKIVDGKKAEALASEIRAICKRIPEKGGQIPAAFVEAMKDGTPLDTFADLISASLFGQQIEYSRTMIEQPIVEKRLAILLEVFDQMINRN